MSSSMDQHATHGIAMVKDEKMELRIDSKSAIDLAKHPVAHGKSKHIETKFHFLRD